MSYGIFPVRPRPTNDESFSGYLTRLCYENGRTSFQQLFQILQLNYRPSSHNSREGEFLQLIGKLAPAIKLTDVELKYQFSNGYRYFSPSRTIRDVSLRHPRFCPICLVECGYHKRDWELLTNTHCDVHKILLVDRCADCGSLASWDSFNFNYCAFCKKNWIPVQTETFSLPPYHGLMPGTDSFEALISCFHYSLRPCDLIFESVQTLNLCNEDIYIHLMQAHYLLSNRRFRREWFERYNDFSGDFNVRRLLTTIENDIERLSNSYGSAGTLSQYFEEKFLVKKPIYVLCRKTRLKLANGEADLNAQLKISEAAKFLKIDLRSLHYLSRQKIVRPLNPTDPHRMQIFDVRDLKSVSDCLIEKCISLSGDAASGELLTSLSDFEKKLTVFDFHRGQLIELLLGSDLILILPPDANCWSDIKTNIYSLINFLESAFLRSLPEHLSVKAYSAITAIKVSSAPAQNNVISKSHIIEFFSAFINVNRIARLHGVSSTKLKLMLAKHHVLIRQASPSAINPIVKKTDQNWAIIKECISALKAVS
jgi:hypothetical protein